MGNNRVLKILQFINNATKVSLLGVEVLWGNCTFYSSRLGVILAEGVIDLCYVALFEDFSL